MNQARLHLIALTYVVAAGVVPTFIMDFAALKLLALLEGNALLTQIVGIISVASPVIAPVIGVLIFYRFVKIVPKTLWKYCLMYVGMVTALLEIYFYNFEPLWSGLGLIIGVCTGVVLAVLAFLSGKKSTINN